MCPSFLYGAVSFCYCHSQTLYINKFCQTFKNVLAIFSMCFVLCIGDKTFCGNDLFFKVIALEKLKLSYGLCEIFLGHS
jgi:hypothetical protein